MKYTVLLGIFAFSFLTAQCQQTLGEKYKGWRTYSKIDARKRELTGNAAALKPGDIAPDFEAAGPDGKPVRLHAIKAEVLVLDFWASWCPSCKAENRSMAAWYPAYKSKGVEILGFSLDEDAGAWKRALEGGPKAWRHASDLKGIASEVATRYGVHFTPTIFVLDANKRIVSKYQTGERLTAVIDSVLALRSK